MTGLCLLAQYYSPSIPMHRSLLKCHQVFGTMTFITVLCGCKVGLGQHDYDLDEGDYSKIKRVRIFEADISTLAETPAGSHDVPDTLLCQSHIHQE